MNSYNENLQSSVVASLSSQELDLKNAASQLDSAMFSLYYAQGARITAGEKLAATTKQYKDESDLQQAAVENNNVAVNLVDAATEGKNNTALAVNNIATGAANVQVAANAILMLASDVGGIYSMASAADFDTQIYKQAKDANEYMTDTAYEAEYASQLAMEASSLTAKVSTGTVADQATALGTEMQTMLDTLTGQFNVTAQTLATDTAAVATASDTEKKAEGVLEDINVEFYATQSAYMLTNQELNLNLIVPDGNHRVNGELVPYKTNTYYTVSFNPITSPYPPAIKESVGYPVDCYYLFLVKNDKSTTFSITSAEALIDEDDKTMFINLGPTPANGAKFFSEKIFISELKDSDGDDMVLGENYTIFMYAKMSEYYQKTLNNFDDFLSAPSAEFNIVNQLESPEHEHIHVHTKPLTEKESEENEKPKTEEVVFEVYQDSHFYEDAEYRLYFLPDQRNLVQGLLTAHGLRKLEHEVERLEKIADEFDPKIAELNQEITTLEASISSLEYQKEVKQEEINSTSDPETILQLTAELDQIKDDLRTKRKAKGEASIELKAVEAQKKAAERTIDPNFKTKPGFFFNELMAQQVPGGSYTPVTSIKVNPRNKDLEAKPGYKVIRGTVKFDADMTDNFGNPLVEGMNYVPAILATVKDSNPNPDQFAISLSDFARTKHFKYVK